MNNSSQVVLPDDQNRPPDRVRPNCHQWARASRTTEGTWTFDCLNRCAARGFVPVDQGGRLENTIPK